VEDAQLLATVSKSKSFTKDQLFESVQLSGMGHKNDGVDFSIFDIHEIA